MTGGRYSQQTVAQYSETGQVTFLANLTSGRWAHACGNYVGDEGAQVSVNGNIIEKILSLDVIDFAGQWRI